MICIENLSPLTCLAAQELLDQPKIALHSIRRYPSRLSRRLPQKRGNLLPTILKKSSRFLIAVLPQRFRITPHHLHQTLIHQLTLCRENGIGVLSGAQQELVNQRHIGPLPFLIDRLGWIGGLRVHEGREAG
jgi:hypothetical protein